VSFFFSYCSLPLRYLHSFPTRRSSDLFAECVKTEFDPCLVTIEELIAYLFEIIDPYSINKHGEDTGEKYRTGIYSENPEHLKQRSEEHTSELQSRFDLVCRLLLEKKNK